MRRDQQAQMRGAADGSCRRSPSASSTFWPFRSASPAVQRRVGMARRTPGAAPGRRRGRSVGILRSMTRSKPERSRLRHLDPPGHVNFVHQAGDQELGKLRVDAAAFEQLVLLHREQHEVAVGPQRVPRHLQRPPAFRLEPLDRLARDFSVRLGPTPVGELSLRAAADWSDGQRTCRSVASSAPPSLRNCRRSRVLSIAPPGEKVLTLPRHRDRACKTSQL